MSTSRHRSETEKAKISLFTRKPIPPQNVRPGFEGHESEKGHTEHPTHDGEGYRINHNGHRVTPGIQPDGESGRKWFHPWHFVRICFRSSSTASQWTNVLWPFTIAAMILHFAFPELELWIFITAYVGMVPAANLVGFAGQELARKIPKVAGVILETTFGSLVEIILFMVLIKGGNSKVPIIRAAILGSILANMLLCLGKLGLSRSLHQSPRAHSLLRSLLLHRRYLPPPADFPRSHQRSG